MGRPQAWLIALLPVLLAALPVAASQAAGFPGPIPSVALPAAVDVAPDYEGQAVCDPTDKDGVVALRQLLLATYGPAVIGLSRACGTTVSEHYDGRALDWMRSVRVPDQAAQAEAFLAWLLAPGGDGTPQEMARRLGIMYVIWNSQMIRMYDPERGWTEYKGCLAADKASPALDTGCHRDHIHMSLTWDGAAKLTSWWTGAALLTPGGAPIMSIPGDAGVMTSPVTAPATSSPAAGAGTQGVALVAPPQAPPRAPRSVAVRSAKGAVTVTWRAPKRAAASQVTGYLVSARAGSRTGPVAGTCTATRTARICWVSDLPAGMRYWVGVSATNLAGASRPELRSVLVR